MERESKYEIFTEDYWLVLLAVDNMLKVKAMNYLSDKISKFSTSIQFDDKNPLSICFESNLEVISMIKSGNNYQIDFEKRMFAIKWRIVAEGFSKDVILPFKLNNEKLTEIQQLKCQNFMLKRRLSHFKTDPMNKTINEQNNFYIKVQSKDISESTYKNVFESKEQVQIQISSQGYNKNKNDNEKDQSFDQGGQDPVSKKQKRKMIKKSLKISNSQLCLQKQKIKKKQKQKQIIKDQEKEKEQKKKGRKKKQQIGIQKQQNIIQPGLTSTNKVKISFPNGDYYYGQIQNNLYHGYGLYYSETNGTFQGIWEKGKANGFGISLDRSGNRHSGFYIEDKRTGKGIDQYVNGQKYSGNFQLDCKSGFGKYIYQNGDYYQGYWKNDMYDGKGVQTYQDGSRYEGYWITDQKDGEGVFINHQGRAFRQYWSKGVKQREEQIK